MPFALRTRLLVPVSLLSLALTLLFAALVTAQSTPPYRDPKLPIEQRIADLLSRMTLEEKVAQMGSAWENPGFRNVQKTFFVDEKGNFLPSQAAIVLKDGIGQISRPGEGRNARTMAEYTNTVQKWVRDNTRLGIPVLFHVECLHGFVAPGATSYPQAIALASTWEPALPAPSSASLRSSISPATLAGAAPKKLTARTPTSSRKSASPPSADSRGPVLSSTNPTSPPPPSTSRFTPSPSPAPTSVPATTPSAWSAMISSVPSKSPSNRATSRTLCPPTTKLTAFPPIATGISSATFFAASGVFRAPSPPTTSASPNSAPSITSFRTMPPPPALPSMPAWISNSLSSPPIPALSRRFIRARSPKRRLTAPSLAFSA